MTLESKVPHMLKYLQDQGLKKIMGGLQEETDLVLDRMIEVAIQCRSHKKERGKCIFTCIKDGHELQNFACM